MFNFGPFELLVVFGSPLTGIVTAVYLCLTLRGNARRAQERR